MLKILNLLFCSLGLLVTSTAFAGRYDKEMKLLEKNTADFIAVSEKKLADLDAVIKAWEQIDGYSKEITAILKFRVNTVNPNADDSIKQLQALNDEKVYVENTLEGLSVIKPKMMAAAKNIKKLLEIVPTVKEKTLLKLSNVLNSADEIESTFKNRKLDVDASLETWRLWQLEIAAEAQAKNQYTVMNSLEVVKTLDQISGAFSILNLNFFIAIKNREYQDAENILQGYAWFKSVFPFFFTDKITNQDQSELLNQIIANAETEQQEMTKALERIAAKSVLSSSLSL